MNKKDRQQLRSSLAKDLVQGQGDHSPTRELLRQYTPLEGIVSANEELPQADCMNTADSALAPHATVASCAMVRGELKVPNTINFSPFPTLEPYAKVVYYQLFLLSHGFHRDTCIIGLHRLAGSVLMSTRKVQQTITYLEKRGLVKRLQSILGGSMKGSIYQVMLPAAMPAADSTSRGGANTLARHATRAPHATVAGPATVARHATNKVDNDDELKSSSSKGNDDASAVKTAQGHSRAAAPRERKPDSGTGLDRIREIYEKVTGNRWSPSDTETFLENRLDQAPGDRIIATMEAGASRNPGRINSFKYFVREIVAVPDPRNRSWRKKQLERIIRRIRDHATGQSGYTNADFMEDVKCACARQDVMFDHDLFNELAG
jgi:hypothetical protein